MPPRLTFCRAALAAACLCLGFATPSGAVITNGRLQIIHMDVGQGDGTVLITPGGQVVLIDDGTYQKTSAPYPQLQALGVTQVDLHFASHYHADHVGCISQIAAHIPILSGWDRAESYNSGTYTTYVNTLGANRHTLVKGQTWTLDSLSAHPVIIKCIDLKGAGLSVSDENSKSVMLKVSYGEFDESFGGDLTGSTIESGTADVESVVAPEVGPVEVYKVHHHGSQYSSNDTWLSVTHPQIAVIQCGNGNTYGHPTAAALGRLHAHLVRTYWNELGTGATPDPNWDRVASGQVIIEATWEPAGIDTVKGPGFADTFINSGTAADNISPTVAIQAPIGGEHWDAGTSQTIQWTATDNVGVDSVNVDVSYLGPAGPWLAIQHGLIGVNSLSWAIPSDVQTDSALVRVTAFDHAHNLGIASSDSSFYIHPTVPLSVGTDPLFGLALSRPEPNPSTGSVRLSFRLPASGGARLDVLDVSGRRAWSWEGAELSAGDHSVAWDGNVVGGARVSGGLFWVRLTSDAGVRVQKLVRLQ